MKRILFVLALSIFSLNSFATSDTAIDTKATVQQTSTIELYIDAKGKVLVDGKKTSLRKLESTLMDLKKNKGTVKFASNQSAQITEKRSEVLNLFRKHKISVEVYSDKTFSKVVRF